MLLYPDATKPTTTVNVTYLVGSRYENYGETGMAHLLEHMLFKGTPSIKSVFSELSRRGAEFNGNTSYDRTNYFETFTASEANLDWALKMESERMTRSTFSKPELDSEMTVVRNEFERGENEPTSVLWKRMAAGAFDWHNYGKPTIGARSDIENVPFERLRAFYARYYQPDNAVLTIAGQFDPARTLARGRAHFGALPKPTRVLPKQYTVEPVQDGEREVTVRRVASTQYVAALFHMPPGPHAGRHRGRGARRDHDGAARRPPVQVAGRDAQGVGRVELLLRAARPGLRDLLRAGAARREAGRRARERCSTR